MFFSALRTIFGKKFEKKSNFGEFFQLIYGFVSFAQWQGYIKFGYHGFPNDQFDIDFRWVKKVIISLK